MQTAIPITGGIRRDVDDSAMSPGSFRDILGARLDIQGALTGLYRGRTLTNFDGLGALTRWIKWGSRYLSLHTNPETTVAITDGGSYVNGPAGDGRACAYSEYMALAVSGAQAKILVDDSVSDPFTNSSCYMSLVTIEALKTGVSGTGSVTLTLSALAPNAAYPTGYTPQYVMFDADVSRGGVTAQIRPVTACTPAPGPCISVTYTGDQPPADTSYVRLLMGTSATDTFKPDGFFVYRGRLCAWKDGTIYYSGYPGNSTPYLASNQWDWSYWLPENSSTTGESDQNDIVRCVVHKDIILAFCARKVFRFFGEMPIDGEDNQIQKEVVAEDLGIESYDCVSATNDGSNVYFVGTDGNFYSITEGEISAPIRKHEKMRGITFVASADQHVVFAGNTSDPSLVANDANLTQSGILLQYPCAYILNTETGAWSTFQPVGIDTTAALCPLDDPATVGGIGVIEQDGREYIAIGSKLGIHILNDPALGLVSADDYYCFGIQTPAFAVNGTGMKQVTSLSAVVESPAVPRLGCCAPADSPINLANSKVVRASAQRVNTNQSVYELNTPRAISNYMSGAWGYIGETLLDGNASWPLGRTALALGADLYLSPYTTYERGLVSRFDVIFSALTSATLEIYSDNGADAPDLTDILYSTAVKEAHSGLTGTGEYWHSFDVRLTLDPGTYWFGLKGTGTVKRSGSPKTMKLQTAPTTTATAFTGSAFVARLVRELGAPFACKRMTSLSMKWNQVGARSW